MFVSVTEFSYLCRTSRHIAAIGINQHTYDTCMMQFILQCPRNVASQPKCFFGQPSFSIVFQEFLEWIKQCVDEACSNNDLYYPSMLQMPVNALSFINTYFYFTVLVAHNGFALIICS